MFQSSAGDTYLYDLHPSHPLGPDQHADTSQITFIDVPFNGQREPLDATLSQDPVESESFEGWQPDLRYQHSCHRDQSDANIPGAIEGDGFRLGDSDLDMELDALLAPAVHLGMTRFDMLERSSFNMSEESLNEPSEVSQDVASADGRISSDTSTAGPSFHPRPETTPEGNMPPMESKVTKGAYGTSCDLCRTYKKGCVRDARGAPCRRCKLKMLDCTNDKRFKRPRRPPGVLNGQGKGKGEREEEGCGGITAPAKRENMQEDVKEIAPTETQRKGWGKRKA
ncbi:hypothetical protein OBBRIDRAFT_883154 [Obba rivulosa]|uniref:Zn(2)-C6 fungal-type domain-containing protein n=1 Tax=Obba rivulosa TaxID=1052685 RepID=A0A8E2DVM9_9APHY|nr:hypothetical protein OBBRIDRAFT_883154 [Obba rivulosa]